MKFSLNSSAVRLAGCALLMGLALVNQASAAAMVSTADGNGADTYLSNDSQNASQGPDMAHGADTAMSLRKLPDTRAKLPMIRFDISTLDAISGAKLTITVTGDDTSGIQPFTLWGLNDGNAGENWDEATVSYSDAPGVDNSATIGNYIIDGAQSTSLITVDVDGSVDAPYDVSFSGAALESFLTADTNDLVTFFISNDNDSGKSYTLRSKEDTSGIGPTLMIPEPATLTMVMAGMLGLVSVARRSRQ